MSDDDGKRSWNIVVDGVFAAFGQAVNRSPTMLAAVELGARFVDLQATTTTIVFDLRALFLGLVLAGQQDRTALRIGNTAGWFVEWLDGRLTDGDMVRGVTAARTAPPDDVLDSAAKGFGIILSGSLRSLIQPAEQIAQRTVGRSRFDARHLFAAMIQAGVVASQVQTVFGVRLGPDDIADLKRTLVTQFTADPEPGETRATWEAVLGLAEPSAPGTGSDRPARDGVTNISRDSIPDAQDDLLDTGGDVRALARLICLKNAAPMAIAIFGGWGSGKSTFMDRIDREVRRIARNEAARAATAAPHDPNAAQFVSRVVPIRFNAWQFVDANLWASLTAEFFDQLRAGGWDRVGEARHAALVEQVNIHVHSLTGFAEADRRAATAGGKALLKVQKDRDQAAQDAQRAPGETFGQATLDVLSDVFEAQKPNLAALGMSTTGPGVGRSVDEIVSVVKDSATAWGQIQAVARVLGRSPGRKAFAVRAAQFAALCLLVWWLVPQVNLAALFGAVAAIGTAATAAAPAVRLVLSVARRSADIARAVEQADNSANRRLLEQEVNLREATAEAQALQAAADRSARSLARYIDPLGAPNPPRLLRYVLEDDPDTKALEKEIGLIGRTRRLFQAVDEIVRKQPGKSAGGLTDPEVPDRIVLYIDDLDRCTEQQVYAVLQAIHLLLAFDLFVVVVGVDQGWVQNALARQFAPEGGPAEDEKQRRVRAIQYLEKIFQIAFWLSPLSSNAETGGTFATYVRALAGATTSSGQERSADTADRTGAGTGTGAGTDRTEGGAGSGTGTGEAGHGSADAGRGSAGGGADAGAQEREVLATIQLDGLEVDFLASPAIAAVAGGTPRSVKRLVNMYRLVRTRLGETGAAILGEPGTPPDYPLIALAVAIESGQTVEMADTFHDLLTSNEDTTGLLDLLVRDDAPAAPGVQDPMACIQRAATEAARLRGGDLKVADALRVARIARRYSFNRFR
ncbi:MAG: P-loop NTPase fold protein [Acetobacteraceae bacterium]